MFCKNCGSPINDGDKVCAKCGYPKSTESTETAGAQESGKTKKVKKRNTRKIAVISAILLAFILIIAGIIIVATKGAAIANARREESMEPEEYYQYIEKQEMTRMAAHIAGLYNGMLKEGLNFSNKSTHMEVQFEVGEDLQRLLNESRGGSYSWLDQLGVVFDGNSKRDGFSAALTFQKEQEAFAHGTIGLDLKTEKVYIQIPEVFSKVMGIEEDFLFAFIFGSVLDADEANEFFHFFSGFSEGLPNEERVEALLDKYFTLAVSCVDDVKKSKDTLIAGGVSAEYTLLTATLDEDTIQQIAELILETMEEDDELEAIILEAASVQDYVDGEEIYEVFVQALENCLEQVNRGWSDVELKVKLWVDKEGNVRGRSIEDKKEKNFEVSYALPYDGEKVGLGAVLSSNGIKYKVSGSVTRVKGKWNGAFDLKCNGSKRFTFRMENVEKADENDISGTVYVTPSKTVLRSWEKMYDFEFDNFGLKLDFSFASNSRRFMLSVQEEKESIGAFTVEMATAEGVKTEFPKENQIASIDEKTELMVFLAEAEEEKLLEKFGELKLPTAFINSFYDYFADVRYGLAQIYLETEKYEEALQRFENAGEYRDARVRSEECRYKLALKKVFAKEYEAAKKVLEGTNGCAYVSEIKSLKQYIDAFEAFENKEYADAKELFEQIADQYDVSSELLECNYQVALGYMEKKEYDKAKEILEAISGQYDVTESLTECNYQLALGYMEAGSDEKAKALFMILGDYKESKANMETILARESAWAVGDVVIFGTYEQDNNVHNGAEPIEWIVLEVKNNKALLISKYALDFKRYNETWDYVTWETCTLRSWLNNDFYTGAFTKEERNRIVRTTLKNKDNSYFGTDSGNDTKDRIFVLSEEEAEKYFDTNSARTVQLTEYAKVQGGWYSTSGGEYGNGAWWLRTAGMSNDFVMLVSSDGRVGTSGDSVACYGDIDAYGNKEGGRNAVVRPAMWIKQE